MSIEEKIDLLLAKVTALEAGQASPAKLSLSVADAMELADAKSRSAFHRFCVASKLKSYRAGKYRRADVIDAINRMAATARRATA